MNIQSYNRLFEKATASIGNPDKQKTLLAWHNRAVTTRQALLTVKEEHKKKLAEIDETYSPAVAFEKRKDVEADFEAVKKTAIKRISDDLEGVLEGKRIAFERANRAPTDEQLRLLQALSLRSSLTDSEVSYYVDQLKSSLPALRVLRDLCQKNDILFPQRVGDPQDFEDNMNRAESFATSFLDSVDTDRADLGYSALEFWEYAGTGLPAALFGDIDRDPYSAIQSADKPVNAPANDGTHAQQNAPQKADSGELWAAVTIREGQRADVIAAQFHCSLADVRRANGGRDLNYLRAGETILVPSTRYQFVPDQNGSHIQPNQVKPVPRPAEIVPHGPNGEEPGDYIQIGGESK